MDFATRIILYFVDYALVDEGGRNSIRIQMENVKFSCHSSFFCAHCRVVFSLCTSGPTDSHFISHSKLDMTGKWALPLGLLIEFIGRVGKKKNEDLELDLAGVNGTGFGRNREFSNKSQPTVENLRIFLASF